MKSTWGLFTTSIKLKLYQNNKRQKSAISLLTNLYNFAIYKYTE